MSPSSQIEFRLLSEIGTVSGLPGACSTSAEAPSPCAADSKAARSPVPSACSTEFEPISAFLLAAAQSAGRAPLSVARIRRCRLSSQSSSARLPAALTPGTGLSPSPRSRSLICLSWSPAKKRFRTLLFRRSFASVRVKWGASTHPTISPTPRQLLASGQVLLRALAADFRAPPGRHPACLRARGRVGFRLQYLLEPADRVAVGVRAPVAGSGLRLEGCCAAWSESRPERATHRVVRSSRAYSGPWPLPLPTTPGPSAA